MKQVMGLNPNRTLRVGTVKEHALDLCLSCIAGGECQIRQSVERIPTHHPKVIEECPDYKAEEL